MSCTVSFSTTWFVRNLSGKDKVSKVSLCLSEPEGEALHAVQQILLAGADEERGGLQHIDHRRQAPSQLSQAAGLEVCN